MGPHPLLRRLAHTLSLLFLLTLALPSLASSQAQPPGTPDLTPEARARLTQAAADTTLPEWQREYMQGLAGGGSPASEPTVSGDRTADPAGTMAEADGWWMRPAPGGRFGHTAIYDPVRRRMVGFGGSGPLNDVWTLSLAGDPIWTELVPTGTTPSPRQFHSAIYDPIRDRMIVFGGSNGGTIPVQLYNDIWALSLVGTPAWTEMTPAIGARPAARAGHSAIYDPVRDRMIVFGGGNSDLWALSLAGTPAWTQLAQTGTAPGLLEHHAAIYDPVRDRMLVFGGDLAGSSLNATYALTLAGTPVWTKLAPSGTLPTPRSEHTAIYDPVQDRMLVYGGYDERAHVSLTDVSELSLAGTPTWTPLAPTGTIPPKRFAHTAIYDPVCGGMVIFAGSNAADAWVLTLAGTPAWTSLYVPETAPVARRNHSSVYDPIRDRMIVFGGEGPAGTYRNDLWELSMPGTPRWTLLTPVGTLPSTRTRHSAIYDPIRDRMIVFGGWSVSDRNDVWALSLLGTPIWSQLWPAGTPPSPREGHSAIYDPVRDRMVVFGGYDGSSRDDVWALALTGTPAWYQLAPAGAPPSPRNGHAATYDPIRDRMWIIGGWNGTTYFNDVGSLMLSGSPTWSVPTPTGTPPGVRQGHTAVYDPLRDRIVVFGGFNGVEFPSNDVWALALRNAPVWSRLAPAGQVPGIRYGHTAIFDSYRGRMWAFGGYNGAFFDDVWELAWSEGPPTDVLASLVSADATAERVRLEWALGSGAGSAANVYRRTASSAWEALATLSADGTRHVVYEDAAVTPGSRFGYRLGIVQGGGETFVGETWVEVPTSASFALGGAQPNPAVEDGLNLRFTLPDGARASLELYDVRGRRVWDQEVGGLGAGAHLLRVGDGTRLAPGVYLARLVRGERALTSRVVVMR